MDHVSSTSICPVDPCPPHLGSDGASLEFAEWLAVNTTGLADLAGWLGGAVWRRRTERLCDGARTGFVDEDETYEVLDLFSLQHVGDPGRPETVLFALVDLDHPNVHACCLAAESLSRGLLAIADERSDAAGISQPRAMGRAA